MSAIKDFFRDHNRGPHVYAHRGAHQTLPENTIHAFEAAMGQGAHGVELDVRLCASADVVVFHDADLMRMAGRPERVADLGWQDLRKVDLGNGCRVPLLDDALDLLHSHDAVVNVELKADGACSRSLVNAVSRVLQAQSSASRARIVCSSFSSLTVALLLKAGQVPVSYLLSTKHHPRVRAQLAKMCSSLSGLHPHHSLVTDADVAIWHKHGWLVNTWTVDALDDIQAMDRAGVDGIITNDVPGTLRALLDGASQPRGTS